MAKGYTPHEEVVRELEPISADEKALAEEYLAALDRLEAAQGAEVTDTQSRLVNVVLIAAHHLRGERSLAAWAEYSGIPEEEIRAVATALTSAPRPVAKAG